MSEAENVLSITKSLWVPDEEMMKANFKWMLNVATCNDDNILWNLVIGL